MRDEPPKLFMWIVILAVLVGFGFGLAYLEYVGVIDLPYVS